MADLEKESVCFCTPSVQVKFLHLGPARLGMRHMKRIRRPGDNRAFADPPFEFNAKREKPILDEEVVMK
jgi:hypothetical protein